MKFFIFNMALPKIFIHLHLVCAFALIPSALFSVPGKKKDLSYLLFTKNVFMILNKYVR